MKRPRSYSRDPAQRRPSPPADNFERGVFAAFKAANGGHRLFG
jgi:hypothetical protein